MILRQELRREDFKLRNFKFRQLVFEFAEVAEPADDADRRIFDFRRDAVARLLG